MGRGVSSTEEADVLWTTFFPSKEEVRLTEMLEALHQEVLKMNVSARQGGGTEKDDGKEDKTAIGEREKEWEDCFESFESLLRSWNSADSLKTKEFTQIWDKRSRTSDDISLRKSQFRYLWVWVGPKRSILFTFAALRKFVERERLLAGAGLTFLFHEGEEREREARGGIENPSEKEKEGGKSAKKTTQLLTSILKDSREREGSKETIKKREANRKSGWVLQLSHQSSARQFLCLSQDEQKKILLFFTLSEFGTIEMSPWYPRHTPLGRVISFAEKEFDSRLKVEVYVGPSTIFREHTYAQVKMILPP